MKFAITARLAAGFALALAIAAPAQARDNLEAAFDTALGTQVRAPQDFTARYETPLAQQIAQIADASQGRIGVAAVDLVTGQEVAVLGDQRFPMASTSKIAIAATFLEGPGLAPCHVFHDLDGEDHAPLPDLGHVRMILQVGHGPAQMGCECAVALEHRLFAEDGQRGVRRRAGQRVARVAVRVEEGIELRVFILEGVVDLRRGEHGGQWQVPTRKSL
jgi:hypothetical protein